MQIRDYQIELALEAVKRLKQLGICYLAAEVRTGKTLTALTAANMYGAKRVLFFTPKKAISSIAKDYASFGFSYFLHVTNYEQASKIDNTYDFIIIDEAHNLGAFPKPSKRTQVIKELVGKKPVILLSGTPSPESYSQLFHQFWISGNSPFKNGNFYKWAKEFVNIKERMINGFRIKDYSRANINMVERIIKPYMVSFTQKEAGFSEEVSEKICSVDMDPKITKLVEIMLSEKIYKCKNEEIILADTPAKLQSKVHQICSGTVITESGAKMILDTSKAKYILENYKGRKTAVFYKFKAEEALLKETITNWTENPEEFNLSNNLVFFSQIRSGAMGINLSSADVIIFYNIDFSSVLYWQARARSQSKERTKTAEIHWLFSTRGIEEKIYEAVKKKKDYTTRYFERDYLWTKEQYKKSA